MTTPKGKRDFHDRDRIDLTDRHEVEYWSKRWGISRDELASAAHKSGPMVRDVAAELGKTLGS